MSRLVDERTTFIDNRKRLIYFNKRQQVAYIIPDQEQNKLIFYRSRFALVLVLAIILTSVLEAAYMPYLLGVTLLILIEVYFRFVFLKKLKTDNNFRCTSVKPMTQSMLESSTPGKIMIKSLLYFAFAALILVNSYQTNHQTFDLFSLALSLGGAYLGCLNVYVLIKSKI